MNGLPNSVRRMASVWSEIAFPDEFGDAVRYARNMHEHSFEFYLARLRQVGFRGESVLDAGCGTATWAFPMTVDSGHVHAVDRNPPRVGLAQWLTDEHSVTNLSISDADITAMEFPTGLFDAVWCYGVVISYLDLSVVLKEFRRVIRKGGLLYMCINGPGWTQYLRKERATQGGDRYREMGEIGAYNTVCQTVLDPVRLALLEGTSRVPEEFIRAFADVDVDDIDLDAAYQLLLRLGDYFRDGGPNPVIKAVDVIERECGRTYVLTLLKDLRSVMLGAEKVFSHNRASRGYRPDEVAARLTDAGFGAFRWADEGALLTSGYTESAGALFDGWFEGLRMVWEFQAQGV